MKKITPVLIILIAAFFTYKFIRWNYWKVERATALAKGILNAPPAVNLALLKENNPLFRKSFAFNPKGNYYLINSFDITPYITAEGMLSLDIRVNHHRGQHPRVHTFELFNIIPFENHYFVFITPACTIEKFIAVKDSLPTVINTLRANAASPTKPPEPRIEGYL